MITLQKRIENPLIRLIANVKVFLILHASQSATDLSSVASQNETKITKLGDAISQTCSIRMRCKV